MVQPLVSILINNYNYGQFLASAIESALNQTYETIEVIVVDDGSTDQSSQVLARYGSTINIILKSNGGQASTFNAGFAACRGEIICFLDADDLFMPDKVRQIVQIFEQDGSLGWCFHALDLWNDSADQMIAPQALGSSGRYDISDAVQQGKLAGKLPFAGAATSGLCFRRSLLAQILPMPEVIRITSDDYLKYVAWGTVAGYAITQPLAIQRIHGNNAYTLRSDKQQLRAKIHCLTAYWLRQNFPVLKTFANNLLAAGINLYRGTDPMSHQDRSLVRQYLNQSSMQERWGIHLRSFYYFAKSLVLNRQASG